MTRDEFYSFIGTNYHTFVHHGMTKCGGADKVPRVQDAVQDAILKLYRIWQERPDYDFSLGFALCVVRSSLIDTFRKDSRRPQIDHAAEVDDAEKSRKAAPEYIDTAKEDDVRAAVWELTYPLQRVIFLRYYAGWDNEMISNKLKISKSQVSRDIHRAHARLREKLKQWSPKPEGGPSGR